MLRRPSNTGVQVGPGTDLATRYAVIVSFGVLLKGTALDQVASLVGVNASSEAVLDTLVRWSEGRTLNDFKVLCSSLRLSLDWKCLLRPPSCADAKPIWS